MPLFSFYFCIQIVQETFTLEEMTNHYYFQMNKEREIRIDTSKTLAASELSVGQLKQKLAEEESARQSADSALSIL